MFFQITEKGICFSVVFKQSSKQLQEGGDVCTHMDDSLHHTTETNTTL